METTRAWVDFNLIKAAVTMEMLIARYGLSSLARSGDELRGACPVHQGKSRREFSINLAKNTFCCFAPACKARGNVLDFVARMERCTVRDAALKLDEWFAVTETEAGERELRVVPDQPACRADALAALAAEVETHAALASRHAAAAEAKFAELKQLIAAR